MGLLKRLFGGGGTSGESDLAAKVAATYALQYMLDHGTTPSQETVTRWCAKLKGLSRMELLQLGSDMKALKRFLG